MRYPFVRPLIPLPERWTPHLSAAFAQRYFTNFGPVEQTFTLRLAERFASEGTGCVLANNATAGLTTALLAAGACGTVAVPAFTFPATAHAALAARCDVVLCDVDEDTWELSADALDELIERTPGITAVVPVRVFGFVRDLSPVRRIAAQRRLPLVIDSAAALGVAKVNCDATDAAPVFEVFSLHATKSFGIGEGGAIFGPRAHLPELRRRMNFGLNPDRSFDFGINGKMSEFQAAIGLAVLQQIDDFSHSRLQVTREFDSFFSGYRDLTIGLSRGKHPGTNYPVLFPAEFPLQEFCDDALSGGLQLRRYYFPSLSSVNINGICCTAPTRVADQLAARMACVPVYADATSGEVEDICEILADLLNLYGVR